MTSQINLNFNKSFDRMNTGFSVPSLVLKPYQPVNLPEPETTVTIQKPVENTVSEPTKPVENKSENKNNEPKKNSKPLGKIVFGSMLVAGIVVLGLTKGLSGSTAQKIRRMADKWEDNFLRYACKNKAANTIDSQIVKSSQRVKKLFNLSDAIANFTAIKDTVAHQITSWNFLNIKGVKALQFPRLHKFLNKYIPIQKACDFVTKHVLKITESAVDSKYANVSTSLEFLEAGLRKSLESVRATASPERVAKIEKMIDSISGVYRSGFSKSVRNQRLAAIHRGLADLAENVKNGLVKPFKKGDKIKSFKKVYSSYVTQSFSAPTQNAHKKALNSAKVVFSNEISDVYGKMRGIANELKHCFAPQDKECRLLFGELLEKFEAYKSLSGSAENKLRKQLQTEILQNLNTIKEKFVSGMGKNADGTIIQRPFEDVKKVSALVTSMKETMEKSSKKGLMQNILTEMKAVLPEKEYKKIKIATQNLNEKLNEAIDTEGNNMFNKIAESKVGSIPTDMLGLATMAGTGIWAVSKGKDKDEKVGATLKVGIPLLGSIGAYFYTAARAFSGTANLLFGAVTAFALNRIGDSIYNYYQKRYVENKTVKEIAQDALDNATAT